MHPDSTITLSPDETMQLVQFLAQRGHRGLAVDILAKAYGHATVKATLRPGAEVPA